MNTKSSLFFQKKKKAPFTTLKHKLEKAKRLPTPSISSKDQTVQTGSCTFTANKESGKAILENTQFKVPTNTPTVNLHIKPREKDMNKEGSERDL